MFIQPWFYQFFCMELQNHGPYPETMGLNQLSRLETLHNSWLRCITRDTVGRPDSISTKDLMEKTHQLPISVMIKERRLRWLGHATRRSDNNMVKQLL